jgi:type I restriction enzyme R subunit
MAGGLNLEARARVLIDKQLEPAEWVVQDRSQIDLVNHAGVAVRETIMDRGAGRADYLLYLNKRVVGVIEAKPSGTTLSEVEWQSRRYAQALTKEQKLGAVLVRDELPSSMSVSIL